MGSLFWATHWPRDRLKSTVELWTYYKETVRCWSSCNLLQFELLTTHLMDAQLGVVDHLVRNAAVERWDVRGRCGHSISISSVYILYNRRKTILCSSSQQLPRLRLRPLKGFLSWHGALQGSSGCLVCVASGTTENQTTLRCAML